MDTVECVKRSKMLKEKLFTATKVKISGAARVTRLHASNRHVTWLTVSD